MCNRNKSVLFIVFLHKLGFLENILPRNDIKENLVQLEEESPLCQAPKLPWGEKEGVQRSGELVCLKLTCWSPRPRGVRCIVKQIEEIS